MTKRKFAAIFDMDGVIVDNDIYHFKAWEVLCTNYGLNTSPEEVKSWFGNTNPMILRKLFGDSLDTEAIDRLGNEKELIYREIYLPDIKPVPGLKLFLDDLRSCNITIAIATSAPTVNVDFVLEHTGLKEYFQFIVDASMITEGKPSPEIYLKASEVLKSMVSDCLVFEDSFHGIESAGRAGMKVVGVATTHPSSKLNGTILNIENFKDINAEKVIQILNNR